MTEVYDKELRDTLSTDFGESYMVDAGAGTGKTTVLVSRITGALATGIPISRIAAITFTEKAAGELLMRVREKIDEKIADNDTDNGRVWLEARSDIENAPIGTIHSFCSSLLRKRPIEAGLDPDFSVVDMVQSRVIVDTEWRNWIIRKLDDRDTDLRELLDFGVGLKNLRGLADSLIDNRDLVAEYLNTHKRADKPNPKRLCDEIDGLMDKARDLSRLCTAPGDDKLHLKFIEFGENVTALKERVKSDPTATFDLKINRNAGAAKNWNPPDAKDRIKDCLKEICDVVKAHNKRIRGFYADRAIEFCVDFVDEYRRAKRKAGVLDFQDLLLETRDMLRDGYGLVAREYFRKSYDLVMVDEFQDTDPLQVEVAFLLSEATTRASSWDRVRPKSGKIFMVGDPKQSIYRFRRADIHMYRRVEESIRDIKRVTLVQNFRSVPALVTWFNEFFSELFNEEHETGAGGPRYENIHPTPFYTPPPGDCTYFPGAWSLEIPNVDYSQKNKLRVAEVRKTESRTVASFIKDACRKGLPVRDPEDKEWRKLEYGDIALLFRNRTGLGYFADALSEAGIPYVAPGSGGLFDKPETRALTACLVAIGRSDDAASLVGALRSTFFGFGDDELLRAKFNGLKFDYTIDAPENPACNEIGKAFAVLRELHAARNSMRKADLISALFAATPASAVFSLDNMDPSHAANIDKIHEIARRFDIDSGGGYSSFLRYLFEFEKLSGIEGGSGLESDQPFVKLMTVHGAKGLEFPMVILADMTVKGGKTDNFLKDRSSGKIFFKFGDLKSRGFDDAKETEKTEQLFEEQRLLYVACTRARDYLIVPTPAAGSPQGFSREAVEFAENDGAKLTRYYDLAAEPSTEKQDIPGKAINVNFSETPETPGPVSKWKARRQGLVESLSRPRRRKSTTEIAKTETEEPVEIKPVETKAMAFGNLVHRALELVDFNKPETVDIAVEQARMEMTGIDADNVDKARNIVKRAIETPLLKRAAHSRRSRKEYPFVIETEKNVTLSGIVDLVFEEDGSLVVIDYKTDDIADQESAAARMDEGYREQGRIYSESLEKITGLKVKEAIILFLGPDPPIALSCL